MIAGLILAAGAGTRFGDQPKQLADLSGRPLLEYAISAQCAWFVQIFEVARSRRMCCSRACSVST